MDVSQMSSNVSKTCIRENRGRLVSVRARSGLKSASQAQNEKVVHLKTGEILDQRREGQCDIFHLSTSVICHSVSTALAYTFARQLSLKQIGVVTFVTTSGCTDQHTAHSLHIGSGAGYRSFR